MKFYTLLLSFGLATATVTQTQPTLPLELDLVELIDHGKLDQLKQKCHAAAVSPSEKATLKTKLIAYATELRTKKVAKLAKLRHHDRRIAGAQAVGLGVLGTPVVLMFLSITKNRVAKMYNESKLTAPITTLKNVVTYFMKYMLARDAHQQLFVLGVASSALSILLPAAYNKAHFAYYGTQPLITEIAMLDQIIVYLTHSA